MPAKAIPYAMPASYMELVGRFPLAHIRDRDHLAAASDMIDSLLVLDLDEGGREYLDALTDLVEVYEDEHYPMGDASEADVLRTLMGGNRLSQCQLAEEVGIAQSTISAVLNGSRSLTKAHITRLAARFGCPRASSCPTPRYKSGGMRLRKLDASHSIESFYGARTSSTE